MDNDKNLEEEIQKGQKMHNDLIRLMRVLDICLDNIEAFHCYVLRKKFLGMSKDN